MTLQAAERRAALPGAVKADRARLQNRKETPLYIRYRRRIMTEGRRFFLGEEFIKFLAALAILPRTILKNRMNCNRMVEKNRMNSSHS